MKTFPVVFKFSDVFTEDGEVIKAMVPLARYGNVCARQFELSEEYPLVVLETRSRASHNHYHACVGEGFKNLPENIAARWQEVDHFRYWCLIETGWFDEQEWNHDTEQAAKTFALQFAAFCRKHNTYVRIMRSGTKVIVRTAKSQSASAMGKKSFEDSKKDILELIESMVGVDPGTLKKQAGRNG